MPEEKNSQRLLRSGIIAGVLMMSMAPIGVIITIFGMVTAFDHMPTSSIPDHGSVSEPIGEVLFPTILGVVVAVAGLAIFNICRKQLRTTPSREEPEATKE